MAPQTRSVKTSSKENVFNNNFAKAAGRNNVGNKAIKRKPLEDKSNSLSDENEGMKTVLKQTFSKRTSNRVCNKENFAKPAGRNNVGNKAIKRKPLEDKSNSFSDENEGMKTVLKQTFSKRTSNRVCNKENCQVNSSFGVLNNPKESNTIEQNEDVYEFTYDPKDEPPSQNKKRKKVTKKKPKPKPKNYFFTQNYDKNLSKTLQKLKAHMKNSATTVDEISCLNNRNQFETQTMNTQVNMEIIVPEKESPPEVAAEPAHVEKKEVEYNISYSPVQSPHSILERSQTPVINDANDVFLEDDITFFDDVPAASSSFITPKHLPASPWRVDMDLLHKTPPVNMCLKPDMTPAVESSFVDDYPVSNKKHVYTNILSEPFENLPQRTETKDNQKQSSILSFIKEVTVKNMKKKKYLTSMKNDSVFDEAVENKESDRNNADDAVVREVRYGINDDDSQSIHLFEDALEIVHHLKANRKSYGKTKKVTFHPTTTSDMDTQGPNDSSDNDNGYIEEKIAKLPAVKKTIKKPVNKKKLSKKEEEEFEAWAADFNSMCEGVEQCPLVVE